MKKKMTGRCPRCGARLERPAPCTHAVHDCGNPGDPITVPLKILGSRQDG